jgi:hypothetical protein
MDVEVKAVVDAINNISTTNTLKDYIFPLLIVLAGGFFAHFSTTYLRYLDAQKEKLDIANDWILGLQEAFNSLVAIKQNYIHKLSEAPLQRAGKFPQIISSSKLLKLQVNKLSFVVQSKDDFLVAVNNHMSPGYISALQSNYNLLVNTLEKRNQIAGRILPILEQHFPARGSHLEVTLEEIYQVVRPSEYLGYIQLTEQVIKTTDELVIAIHNFLCEFPDICRYAIEIKRVKHYRRIIEWHYDRMDILERSTPVNYSCLAELLAIDEQQAREKFSSGYEDIEPIEKTTKMLKNPNVNQAIEKYNKDEAIKIHHRFWWR